MCCWFEPIENGVEALRRAREGLIAGGDLANAGYTYYRRADLLDCAPSLDAASLRRRRVAFARRMGNEQSAQWVANYRWLMAVLRGENSAAAGKPIATESYADNPPALLHAHVTRAIAAAIFGEAEDLDRHTAAAMPLLVTGAAFYISAVARMLRGLALAWQAQRRRRRPARPPGHRAGRADAMARRPRHGRAGELLAPAAAARGRAGLGGRRLLGRHPGLRRHAPGGRWAPAAVAPGLDHRARGSLPPRPRPRVRRPRPAGRGPPALRRLGRDREGRPAGLGLPDPANESRRPLGAAATRPPSPRFSAPRSPPARSTCSASSPPPRR